MARKNWKNIPDNIKQKLDVKERKQMLAQLEEAYDAGRVIGRDEEQKNNAEKTNELTPKESDALLLIHTEMPTFAAQPRVELQNFHLWLDGLVKEKQIKFLKGLARLDTKNGAKLISDIVELETDEEKLLFAVNCGLLI